MCTQTIDDIETISDHSNVFIREIGQHTLGRSAAINKDGFSFDDVLGGGATNAIFFGKVGNLSFGKGRLPAAAMPIAIEYHGAAIGAGEQTMFM